jgi:adenine deaminase
MAHPKKPAVLERGLNLVRGIIVVFKGEITNKLKMAIKGLQTSKDLTKLKEVPTVIISDVRDFNSNME